MSVKHLTFISMYLIDLIRYPTSTSNVWPFPETEDKCMAIVINFRIKNSFQDIYFFQKRVQKHETPYKISYFQIAAYLPVSCHSRDTSTTVICYLGLFLKTKPYKVTQYVVLSRNHYNSLPFQILWAGKQRNKPRNDFIC